MCVALFTNRATFPYTSRLLLLYHTEEAHDFDFNAL